ncbi:MAG: hypothetical protein ACYDC0_16885 [Acidimicrobiales bacterium]
MITTKKEKPMTLPRHSVTLQADGTWTDPTCHGDKTDACHFDSEGDWSPDCMIVEWLENCDSECITGCITDVEINIREWTEDGVQAEVVKR